MASSLSQQTIFPIKAILIFSFLLIFPLNQFADCNQDESKLYQILSNALSSCNTAEVFNIINCDIDPNVTVPLDLPSDGGYHCGLQRYRINAFRKWS